MSAWIVWVATLIVAAISLYLFKRGDPQGAFFGMCIAFGLFIVGVLTKSIAFLTFEQIACWTFAGCTLVFSFRLLQKEKLAEAMVIFFFAFTAFLCGLSSVQGLLKAGVLSKVNDAITDYSQKLDVFQTNIDEAHADFNKRIAAAKRDIQAQQDNITDQFKQISELQFKLATAESNISGQYQTNLTIQSELAEQQAKLTNVQIQLSTLFDRTVTEYYEGTNREHVAMFTKHSDGGVVVAILLANPVIQNSTKIWRLPHSPEFNPQFELVPSPAMGNVVAPQFGAGMNLSALSNSQYVVQYVADPSPTNKSFKQVGLSPDDVLYGNQ